MTEALRWYLALTVIGAGSLLPATLLFERLRSGGVLYARPLALLLVGYAVWMTSAFGLVAYGTPLVVSATAMLWLWSAVLAWRRRALLDGLLRRRRILLVGELLFVALFALIVVVRAQAPAARDTEKPMDLLMLTAVHRTEEFPPRDPWFAGERVSYYHLGHTEVDLTSRIASVDVGTAFTLGVATAGALAGTAVFALAGDLLALSRRRRRASVWIAGGVATTSLLVLATLEGPIDLLVANGLGGEGAWGWLGVNGLPGAVGATDGVPDEFWWWWRATRVLPVVIQEFPAFSLILGDMHAHVLALPLAVVALALAVPTFQGAQPLTWRSWRSSPGPLLLSGLLYAGLVMTNSWDALLYGAVWFAAATAALARAGWPLAGAAFGALRYLAPPGVVALVAAAPFLATVASAPLSLSLVAGAASDPVRFTVAWLPLTIPLLAAAVLIRSRRLPTGMTRAAALVAALPAGWALASIVTGDAGALADRGSGWVVITGLVLAASIAGAASAHAYREGNQAQAAWLGLAACAAVLILVTELVFIEDAFGNRQNTVFKFWFGAWLLLAVAGGTAVAAGLDALPRVRPSAPALAALTAGALVYGGSLLYAPAAAISRAREGQEAGLDALAYLERGNPGQAAALRWVSANLTPADTLLEAVGDQYTAANYLSAASGVPTLLGWAGHELQWRGQPDAITQRRETATRIYEQGASQETRALALAAGITHVYLGREERRQFGPDVTERFAGWPTSFDAPGARIVEVPR